MKYFNLEKENGLVIITLNGIKELNLFNWEILNEFYDILSQLDKDRDVRIIIITGKGKKAFSAGTDLHVELKLNESTGKKWSELGHKITRKIETLSVPVFCVVNGYALGGGMEIVMACDIIIASKDAKFGLPEVKYGIIPGWGSISKLSRMIGKCNAMEIILSGEMIDARDACKIGLVNRIVENPLEEAKSLARKMLENGPLSLKFSKKLINETFYENIENALKTESEYFSKCFSTEDQKEGMKSFFEKRKPKFKGK